MSGHDIISPGNYLMQSCCVTAVMTSLYIMTKPDKVDGHDIQLCHIMQLVYHELYIIDSTYQD